MKAKAMTELDWREYEWPECVVCGTSAPIAEIHDRGGKPHCRKCYKLREKNDKQEQEDSYTVDPHAATNQYIDKRKATTRKAQAEQDYLLAEKGRHSVIKDMFRGVYIKESDGIGNSETLTEHVYDDSALLKTTSTFPKPVEMEKWLFIQLGTDRLARAEQFWMEDFASADGPCYRWEFCKRTEILYFPKTGQIFWQN